jgi:lipopolysaccharide biosynthesis glycosyltransferase
MNLAQTTGCPIVLACDEAYAMPLATTLRSIVDSNPGNWPLDFHVFSDGILQKTRDKILDSLPDGSAEIRWIEVDLKPFLGFSTIPHISKITYARLLIPTVFPDTVPRVLFLDADILVLSELSKLWTTDIKGAVIGAVQDLLDPLIKLSRPGLEKLPRVRSYFNAGVLLIDLVQWRKEQISEKGLEYLSKNPLSPFSDQDALNYACDGLWKRLDDRWNYQRHLEVEISKINETDSPAIVHFVSSAKPWKASIPNMNADFYDSFRSRTLFARNPVDKLKDILIVNLVRLKNHLIQYEIFQGIWQRIKSRGR